MPAAQTMTTAYRDFDKALGVDTSRLARDEWAPAMARVTAKLHELLIRAYCDDIGWPQPEVGTPDWVTLEATYETRMD